MRMHPVCLGLGVAFWAVGTVLLRAIGEAILAPDTVSAIAGLFAVSFAATYLLVRGLCRWLHVPAADASTAAASLILPTLVLDPFSSAFFSTVFPNMPTAAAGLFGGWMLICCAGAVVGGLTAPSSARG